MVRLKVGRPAPHQKVGGVTSSGRAGEKGGGSPHQTWPDRADMIDVNTVEMCVSVSMSVFVMCAHAVIRPSQVGRTSSFIIIIVHNRFLERDGMFLECLDFLERTRRRR